MALIGTCVDQTMLNLTKAKALIAGYEQIRSLQPVERQSLSMIAQYCAILTASWRFEKFNLVSPTLAKAKAHQEMVAIADHFQALPANAFCEKI